jgi:hypothetical protein
MKMVDAAVRNRLFLQAIEEMHAMGGMWSVQDERIHETFRPAWERMTVRLLREADVSAEVMREFESRSPRGKEDCVAELGWCGLNRLVRWFVADALFVRIPRMDEEARAREAAGGGVPAEGFRGH